MAFHDDKLLIEDTYRLSGVELGEELDSMLRAGRSQKKAVMPELTSSGLSLNEEFEQLMGVLGKGSVKKARRGQIRSLSESIEDMQNDEVKEGYQGPGSRDEKWKIYINGEFYIKTDSPDSVIDLEIEQEWNVTDVEWDSEKLEIYVTTSPDEVEEGSCGVNGVKEDFAPRNEVDQLEADHKKIHGVDLDDGQVYDTKFGKMTIQSVSDGQVKVDIEGKPPQDKTKDLARVYGWLKDAKLVSGTQTEDKNKTLGGKPKEEPAKAQDEKAYGKAPKKNVSESKNIYQCLNGLIECLEMGTDFCLNLSEDANRTRKAVSVWLESKILPKMEGILDEMEPTDEVGTVDGDEAMGDDEPDMDMPMTDEPEGDEPEGDDEKVEMKHVSELEAIVQAMRVSIERIDDEDVRVEIQKMADGIDSIVGDLKEMHGVEEPEDEESDEDEVEPEGEPSPEDIDPELNQVSEAKKKIAKDHDWQEGGWKYKSWDKDGGLMFSRVKDGVREVSNRIVMALGVPHYQILKKAEKQGDVQWKKVEAKTEADEPMSEASNPLGQEIQKQDIVNFTDGNTHSLTVGRVVHIDDEGMASVNSGGRLYKVPAKELEKMSENEYRKWLSMHWSNSQAGKKMEDTNDEQSDDEFLNTLLSKKTESDCELDEASDNSYGMGNWEPKYSPKQYVTGEYLRFNYFPNDGISMYTFKHDYKFGITVRDMQSLMEQGFLKMQVNTPGEISLYFKKEAIKK